jgi:hypothetical protein
LGERLFYFQIKMIFALLCVTLCDSVVKGLLLLFLPGSFRTDLASLTAPRRAAASWPFGRSDRHHLLGLRLLGLGGIFRVGGFFELVQGLAQGFGHIGQFIGPEKQKRQDEQQ